MTDKNHWINVIGRAEVEAQKGNLSAAVKGLKDFTRELVPHLLPVIEPHLTIPGKQPSANSRKKKRKPANIRHNPDAINKITQQIERVKKDSAPLLHTANHIAGELFRYSCGREEIMNAFWRRFQEDSFLSKPVRHFFLEDKPYAQSLDILKRIIGEMAVHYENTVRYCAMDDIIVPDVHIAVNSDLSLALAEMKAGALEYLDLKSAVDLFDLATANKENRPELQLYGIIPVIIRIEISRNYWEKSFAEVFAAFVRDYCSLPAKFEPVFVFFYLIRFIDGSFETPDFKKRGKEFKWNLEGLPDNPVFLPEPGLIDHSAVFDWLEKFPVNAAQKQAWIDELIKRQGPGPWDMAALSVFMEKIIEVGSN